MRHCGAVISMFTMIDRVLPQKDIQAPPRWRSGCRSSRDSGEQFRSPI